MKNIISTYWSRLLTLMLIIGGLGVGPHAIGAESQPYDDRPEVEAFIAQVAERHGFDKKALVDLFASVERQTKVLNAISRPAEKKPWYAYRKIFLTPDRIRGGVRYWNANTQLLEQAQRIYGVSPHIIVAIIGVETLYGRRMGSFPVLDSLATLGFDYPPRAKFFRSELEHFLLLAREETLDIEKVKGSYAGAMGKGQFIPSSYRAYAVDFDDDGRRDLWNSNADAIGSVANYFKRHGWILGGPVATPAEVRGSAYESLVAKGMEPTIAPSSLESHGVAVPEGELGEGNVALLEFELRDGHEYWVGFKNFYVITRYNRSPLYAMAVFQLSQEIKKAREKELARR